MALSQARGHVTQGDKNGDGGCDGDVFQWHILNNDDHDNDNDPVW